jgi:hypothetical protein
MPDIVRIRPRYHFPARLQARIDPYRVDADLGTKLRGLDVQARAFPYSASKRLHAFSASGSL